MDSDSDNIWTNDLRTTVTAAAAAYVDAPSWKSHVVVQPKLHDAGATGAFSSSGSTYLAAYSVWDEARDDEINTAWLNGFGQQVRDWAAGHYINEYDVLDPSRSNAAAFSPAAWQKLRELRQRYDPEQRLETLPGLG